MDWWLGPSIIGVIAAGVFIGLVVSFIILRAQKRNLPFFNNKMLSPNRGQLGSFNRTGKPVTSFGTDRRNNETIGIKAKPDLPARDNLEVYHSQPKIPLPSNEQISPQKSDALLELENNLAIASRPMTSQLVNFQTDVWSNRRSEFHLADSTLLGELTEAYVDMLLANNIVWLVMELGRDSRDLAVSYNKLSVKIAERLQRIMPSVRKSL